MMAAAEARGIWQRTAAKCHMVQEDAIRSPKVVDCSLPNIICKSQGDACHPMGYSYYWSNSCFSPESKLDLHWPSNSNTDKKYHSELDESLNARFSKPTGLQSLAIESNSAMKGGPGLINVTSEIYNTTELELKWNFVIDPEPQSGLITPNPELCDVTFEEAMVCDTKNNGLESIQQDFPFHENATETTTKSNGEVGLPRSPMSPHGAFFRRENLSVTNFEIVSQEISEDHDANFGSVARNILWQLPNNEVVVGKFSQKNVKSLDNCSLSCSQSRLVNKAEKSFDCSPSIQKQQDVLQNFCSNIISSVPYPSESHNIENKGELMFSPSLGNLSPTLAEPWYSQRLLEPQSMPSTSGNSSRHGLKSFR